MHYVNPLVLVIVGGFLGVGLITQSRRSEKGQRRLRIFMLGLLLILAALLAVDFITTPEQRWVSGIGLVGALVALGGYGYQRFQDSKTRSKPIR